MMSQRDRPIFFSKEALMPGLNIGPESRHLTTRRMYRNGQDIYRLRNIVFSRHLSF